jgi:hypothetical protein
MRHLIVSSLFLLLFSIGLDAQVTVVENRKPVGRIILSTDDAVDKKAAYLLQDFIQRITGAKVPVQENTNARKHDIIIGNGGLNKEIAKKI